MKIEDVNAAIEGDEIVTINLHGLTLHYKIRGVISRYDRHHKNWHYMLELQDLKANSITVARMEDAELVKVADAIECK